MAVMLIGMLAVGSSACGGRDEKPVCKQGDREMCKCADSAVGIRHCNDKGGGWKECDCRGDYGMPF
jgi:hypothetical protein